MERPMDSWNDERLDELSRRMDEGFKEMREGFARIDQRFEQTASRAETNEVIGEVKAEIRLIHDKLDRLTHALMVGGVSFGLTMFATLGGLLITQV